jgi:hypothetical protein
MSRNGVTTVAWFAFVYSISAESIRSS